MHPQLLDARRGAAFWKWWSLKRREPDEISKMIIGSLFTMAGGAACSWPR